MKDAAELIPTPTKRGRPTTGRAMTAAERKQAQRKRALDILYHGSLDELPTAMLIERIPHLLAAEHQWTLAAVLTEIGRRAGLVVTTKPRTTE